jgi:hypothetical protein
VLLTTRPHQVDRRQQVSGDTGYDQQYGDSEREGDPAGRATSGRVQGGNVPRTASCRAQCGHEAEEKSHQAGGGTKMAICLSRRLQVGDVHKISTPATQPSPLATGPEMISHGAHASQRRLQ